MFSTEVGDCLEGACTVWLRGWRGIGCGVGGLEGWRDGGLEGWMERLTLGFRRFFFFVIPDYEDRSRLARGTV
jgi:hypothetical protein